MAKSSSEHELVVSAEIVATSGKIIPAARMLKSRGFRVLATNETISVDAPVSLWESVFLVNIDKTDRDSRLDTSQQRRVPGSAKTYELRIPEEFQGLVEDVLIVEPPEFFT
jgi:hypothetical protein